MKKTILSLIVCAVLFGANQSFAGKLSVNGSYSFQGYSQTAFGVTASTPFNSRIGYGLGYMFADNDGPRIEATIFTSGQYDATSGKVNINVMAYDLSWLFAINPEWYVAAGLGLGSMSFSTGTNNANFASFIGLGYRLSSDFYIESQYRTDFSVNAGLLSAGFNYSTLAHSISGLNIKVGYLF